ncbi:CAMK family protein kinase [Trichomonas vaginalis G3]|uniref:CAMK family protein kinase n=1 Tax=Trichomonas vaginalis (strain ATCC PRA-98 / G3) TaxID=412133 RepID=A2DX42_TRIV3|nr:protein kinase protein [Trichomonas vaginalis G3]EAY15069.1 CAMK family protein kinase [Trichomonas vaginalis G3]KAI5549635.1 protein kinase protein [Trichomonas vaginalis G3]|eukprot:XP_001327292.1 CAMK family protein kinase [Trichomonas vaginalis G3]
MRNANNPYILKIYEVVEDQKYIYIVEEYVSHGNLLDYFNKRNTISYSLIKKFVSQIIYATKYLNEVLHVTHRDLKLENILLDEYENIKIIDFGLSSIHRHRVKMHKLCGTPEYIAPEVIQNSSYTDNIDTWSIGIILYAMTHRCLPFDGKTTQEIFTNVVRCDPQYDNDIPAGLLKTHLRESD